MIQYWYDRRKEGEGNKESEKTNRESERNKKEKEKRTRTNSVAFVQELALNSHNQPYTI
jgi:hypothetical protein